MNVEELLSQKDIYFSSAGKDVLISCLSPDHDDSNASTRVDRVSGVFHCLSCGHKGNLFEEFNELRDYKNEQIINIRRKIRDIISSSVGLDMPEGWAPFHKPFRGIKPSTYKELGAFTAPEFEDRVVFPIRDINGRIVAFSARHLHSDASPKYIVSPVYVKLPVYPATAVPRFGSMILVEGIFDFINLKDKGVDNVVCLFGTRTTSYNNVEERLMPLMLAGTKSIKIVFDGDTAGKKAAIDLKTLITTKTRLVVDIVELGDGVDPGGLDQSDVNQLINHMYQNKES